MRVVLLLAAITMLSACQLRVYQTTSVADDSSGTVTLLVAADEELRRNLAGFGVADADTNPFESIADGLPDRIDAAPYDEGGFVGMELTGEFADLDDYQRLVDELSGVGGVGVAAPTLTRDGSTYEFGVEVPEFDEDALQGIGSGTGFDISTLPLDDLFDIQVTAGLPGRLIDHNADEISDSGQLVWRLGIDSGPKLLSARSEVASVPGWLAPLATGVVAGGVIIWAVRRKRADPSAGVPEPEV